MTTIKYHASAHFDVDREIELDYPSDDLEVWLAITSDLEQKYGLKIKILDQECS